MKKTTPILLLVSFLFLNLTNCFAQYYKYSIDVNYGLSGVSQPNINDFSHFGVGFNYEFDEIYSLRLDYGSDQFRTFNERIGAEAGLDMSRISLQGAVNLSTISSRIRIYDPINVFVHGGFGLSSIKSTLGSGRDNTVNFLGGITPRIKLTRQLYLSLDASAIFILSQHYNFDGDLAYSDVVNSFTSITYNVTAGLTFRFGEY
jgi:OOP family OmpA-OmpF porin